MRTSIKQALISSFAALVFGVTATASAGHHASEGKPSGNVLEVAGAAGDFSTLVAAVDAADLTATLEGEGPFTVFAPTDDAFAKLPAGTVENLLKPENKVQLIAVLTYHVVPGAVYSQDVVKIDSATSVNGKPIAIAATKDGVRVNDATVVAVDIRATNGVIHVIDEVILPPAG